MSDSEGDGRRQPTKGLRLGGGLSGDDWNLVLTTEDLEVKMMPLSHNDEEQRAADIAYINWLIETDQMRREHLEKLHAGGQDILVDMGNMARVSLENIALDTDYEAMTEDIIQTVNHIILQGVPPIKALFSLSQAFAIVLGFALRANMPFEIAKALLAQVMNSATASEKMVRIVTKQ